MLVEGPLANLKESMIQFSKPRKLMNTINPVSSTPSVSPPPTRSIRLLIHLRHSPGLPLHEHDDVRCEGGHDTGQHLRQVRPDERRWVHFRSSDALGCKHGRTNNFVSFSGPSAYFPSSIGTVPHDRIGFISPERTHSAVTNLPVPIGMFMNMTHIPPRFYNQQQQQMASQQTRLNQKTKGSNGRFNNKPSTNRNQRNGSNPSFNGSVGPIGNVNFNLSQPGFNSQASQDITQPFSQGPLTQTGAPLSMSQMSQPGGFTGLSQPELSQVCTSSVVDRYFELPVVI